MKKILYALAIVLTGLLAAGGPALAGEKDAAALASLKFLDTGVGHEAREAKIPGYQAKLVFANLKGEYLADVDVLIRKGREVRVVHCEGPWLLIKGVPGRYEVTARTGKLLAKRSILLPRKGMKGYLMHLRTSERQKKAPSKKMLPGV